MSRAGAAALALLLVACGHGAAPPAARHVTARGVELVVEGDEATLRKGGTLRIGVTSRVAGGTIDGEGADVLLVLGGLGGDAATVSTSMRMLAATERIVLLLPGGEDEPGRWARAISGLPEAARARLLDLGGLRVVRFGRDTLVPVGGAPSGRYGLTARAAAVEPADLEARAAALGAAAVGERRYLVSWAMPAREGGDPLGDPALAAMAHRAGLGEGPFAWPFEAPGATRPLAGPALEAADGARVLPGPPAVWELGPVGLSRAPDAP